MVSCTIIQFPVAPVSALRMIGFQYLFNTACLNEIRLGGTKVLTLDFNKTFLVLFISNFSNTPHCNSVHT